MENDILNDKYSDFEAKLKKIFNEFVLEFNLHKDTFSYERSFSEKKNKIISCGIFINEMTYPPVDSDTILTSYLVARHKELKKGKLEFLIKKDQFANIAVPESALVKELSDKSYKHIVFDAEDVSLLDYLYNNISYCLKNYKPSTIFGCCSSYKECSNEKKCLHPNFLYAKGCQYRQNLEDGRIFY